MARMAQSQSLRTQWGSLAQALTHVGGLRWLFIVNAEMSQRCVGCFESQRCKRLRSTLIKKNLSHFVMLSSLMQHTHVLTKVFPLNELF